MFYSENLFIQFIFILIYLFLFKFLTKFFWTKKIKKKEKNFFWQKEKNQKNLKLFILGEFPEIFHLFSLIFFNKKCQKTLKKRNFKFVIEKMLGKIILKIKEIWLIKNFRVFEFQVKITFFKTLFFSFFKNLCYI